MNALKLLALTLLAIPAYAADTPTIETLTAAQSEKLTAIFAQQQRNLAEKCQAIGITRAKAIQIGTPLVMDKSGKPTAGEWRVRFAVNTCGTMALRMAEFVVTPKSEIAIRALAPGQTLADSRLQKDVIQSFGRAGALMMPKCTEVPTIRNTVVTVFPASEKERWTELWTGRMCGRDIGQSIDFLPTRTGTTFKMSLPKR